MNFNYFNTKLLADGNDYNLNLPSDRNKYFKAKLKNKIEDLKSYLDTNSFVGFLVAKKGGGKGTFSKMVQEVLGEDRIAHVSIGDIVRGTHKNLENDGFKSDLLNYIDKNYRGYLSKDEVLNSILNRDQSKLIPTDVVLLLVKKEIEKLGKRAVFIDGLPRDDDQISLSLYFRELINFRDDQDFFVLIDVPETLIAERMTGRSVCPKCNTSRNIKTGPSEFVVYDTNSNKYIMLCDNKDCTGYKNEIMVDKEGDKEGLAPIRARLDNDEKLMNMIVELKGIPVIKIRNHILTSDYKDVCEDYELTPEFIYSNKDGNVDISTKPWVLKGDDGNDIVSLMSAACVVSMISQMHDILIGNKVL